MLSTRQWLPGGGGQVGTAYKMHGSERDCYLGLDLGTSGCRVAAIDDAERVLMQVKISWPAAGTDPLTRPALWWEVACRALRCTAARLDGWVPRALAVDGTSGTVLLCDGHGDPLTEALPYYASGFLAEAQCIDRVAPTGSTARGAGSALARALHLLALVREGQGVRVVNQSDWLAAKLCGRIACDANNALKLGYEPVSGHWPDWMDALALPDAFLPEVVGPGTALASILPDRAAALGLPADLLVVAGTTDSVAGVLAAGVSAPATAVTALGSTLVLKLITEEPVFAPQYGVYSHRLGNAWLAGGASNSGGAVLAQYFTVEELEQLSPLLDPENDTGLDYYPLPRRGERFPQANPNLLPRLEPRPSQPHRFLQGMLEGIARIEADGYRRLQTLGAPYPVRVVSAGGGAANRAWSRIRERYLGVPVSVAQHQEACVGTARLARAGAGGHGLSSGRTES